MDSNFENSGAVTPVKETVGLNRSKFNKASKNAENLNPNVLSPGLKFSYSQSIKSERSAKKSASKNNHSDLVASHSPNKRIRGRRFVIAKKKSGTEELNSSTAAVVCSKCEKASGKSRCLCVAYKSLRASQEDFFKNRSEVDDDEAENERVKIDRVGQNPEIVESLEGEMEGNCDLFEISGESEGSIGVIGVNCEMGSKRSRDMLLLQEAGENVPEPISGRVMHLVKAFEKLLTIPKSNNSEEKEVPERNDDEKGLNWELPGFQQPKVCETQDSFSFCPSNFFLTSESLGLQSHRSCSLDSSQGSISTETSACGRGSRRKSTESVGTLAGRHWKKRQPTATSQKPFMLRTEQRGKYKEEEFMKKLQQMMEEEEKLRMPIAQGLPWSTDEPECVVKPPLKENTRPVDLVLHSDIRAVERAGFDHQVAKKTSLIEHYRMERGRKQKQEEEEEIKRLRKELVPKAQPMPYFNKPFIPKKSMKHPTIPREPKLHLSQNKKMKSCISLDDFCVSHSE